MLIDFRQGWEAGGKKIPYERETLISCLPHMCKKPPRYMPNQESNLQPFGAREDEPTHPTEPPGQSNAFNFLQR